MAREELKGEKPEEEKSEDRVIYNDEFDCHKLQDSTLVQVSGT